MSGPADRPASVTTVTTVRVRYPETDRMGRAYHAHYLVWCEMGRTELMRELGRPYAELEEQDGVFFPVIEAGIRYVAPALYDDCVEVRTHLASVGRARVRFAYSLMREADGRLLATGFTEHAAVNRAGRPTRMPRELHERLRSRVVAAAGPEVV